MQATTNTQDSRHYSWSMAIRGILAVLFGLAALVWPGKTILVLVFLFGAYALVDGIIAVFVSLQGRKSLRHWWILLLEGAAGIVVGLLTFAWPAITALVLLYLIAAWAIVTGFFEVTAAFSGRLPIAHEWTLALAGLLSILFGVILAIRPGVGLLSVVWIIALYALIFGVLLIIRAFQFRTAGTPQAI